jgi:hypothetical protein
MTILIRKLAILLTGAVLLASCGSSGNGMGGGGGTPAALATVTSQNAPVIAGAVAREILDNNVIGAIAGTGLPFASAGSNAAATLLRVSSMPLPTNVMAAQMPIEACDVAGTVDVNYTVANPLTLSSGDEFRFDFAACDDGSGVVVSGGLVMTVTAFEGDVANGLFLLGLSVQLNAFEMTEGGETSGASGTIMFEIDTLMPPVTTLTLSTNALTTTSGGVSETVSNLSITITENEGMFPTAFTVDTSFRLSSPSIVGDVIVSTSIALQRSGEEFPFAGEILISAANNSSIVLIALDGNNVRLEIDIDGDGAVDETVDTTWEVLLADAA